MVPILNAKPTTSLRYAVRPACGVESASARIRTSRDSDKTLDHADVLVVVVGRASQEARKEEDVSKILQKAGNFAKQHKTKRENVKSD